MNKIPIISSKCNHGPKEILGNGKFGDLFKVNDYKGLKSKIQNFIDNPKKLQTKSKLFFSSLDRFDTKKIIDKFDYIFKNI